MPVQTPLWTIVLLGGSLGLAQEPAWAQVSLADDIILASKGGGEEGGPPKEQRTELGPMPGSHAGPFRNSPGTSEILLGVSRIATVPSTIQRPGAASPIADPGRGMQEPGRGMFQVPERLQIAPPLQLPVAVVPELGQLDVPEREDEGPASGLTLDMAIDLLVRNNVDLRSKYFEIPMAEADVLTSGLRSNPLLFWNAENVPYGQYSGSRPGATSYSLSVVYPIDVSGKRRARVAVSRQAKRVLEAQYQDAVRLQIENLYRAFVDLLAARQAERFAQASGAHLRGMHQELRSRPKPGEETRDDLATIRIELEVVELLEQDERGRVRKAKRALASLLNLPPGARSTQDYRGPLEVQAPPLPSAEALLALALNYRPDLAAHRLGVGRAQADVRLASADRFADVYLLYQPYGFQDNTPTGQKSATSWGAGLFVSMPIYNRNQGNIQRSRLNVSQSQTQLSHLEREVIDQVENAVDEYADSLNDLTHLAREILPAVRQKRNMAWRKYLQGRIDADAYLSAQRDYNSVVRHYRDTRVRHRRSMLHLNTVVGCRVLP